MPTAPEDAMSRLLVGAPGQLRKGRREPLVTSRTKKLASLAPMSQVCAVKPPADDCSSRMAGVLPGSVCTSSTGVAGRRASRPGELTYRPLLGAPALTAKTCRLAVASSTVKYDAPPEAVSLTQIRHSLAGKVPTLVSSK